jgi:hypothetical protein
LVHRITTRTNASSSGDEHSEEKDILVVELDNAVLRRSPDSERE